MRAISFNDIYGKYKSIFNDSNIQEIANVPDNYERALIGAKKQIPVLISKFQVSKEDWDNNSYNDNIFNNLTFSTDTHVLCAQRQSDSYIIVALLPD